MARKSRSKTESETAQKTSFTENSVEKKALLSKEDFLKKFKISQKTFMSSKIKWIDLVKIHESYVASQDLFQNIATTLISKFLTSDAKDAGVHSVRFRLKNPESVIEKIIRKRLEGKVTKAVTVKNYTNEITDLIGIRILHVFKDDWFGIHNYIQNCQFKFIEIPKVYYRKGDEKHFIDECKKNGCVTEVHPKAYRSIHYIVNPHPQNKVCFAEIQVRTVFEDGWSEIDHKLRYASKKTKRHALDRYLLALNRIAGSADEIGSIIKSRQIELRREESEKQIDNKRSK
ncbi:MAG TPA: GTP pyrophosphokinase [Cytophagales bacterium]|nr:GTP pyrophosphokinase [Cytophagales bacterium]